MEVVFGAKNISPVSFQGRQFALVTEKVGAVWRLSVEAWSTRQEKRG